MLKTNFIHICMFYFRIDDKNMFYLMKKVYMVAKIQT